MKRPQKTTQRMCVGCREMKEKKTLIRIVRTPQGTVEMDLTGKKSGRGAYVCRRLACLQSARKAKRLERAFACAIPDDVYDAMEKELEADGAG